MEKDSEGRENANMVIEYEKESNDFYEQWGGYWFEIFPKTWPKEEESEFNRLLMFILREKAQIGK